MPVIVGPDQDFKPRMLDNIPSRELRCAFCANIILDPYYLSTMDRIWHCGCLKCYHCKVPLERDNRCYERHGYIYCQNDYIKIFRKKCNNCGEGIHPRDLVMKVKENIYHTQCFQCDRCKKTLTRGDLYGIINDLVYCHFHYKSSNSIQRCSPGLETKSDQQAQYLNLNSENAIHPSVDHCTSYSDLISGIPAYGSVYGSPGSNNMSGPSLLNRNCLGAGASVPSSAAGVASAASGHTISSSVKKGRPRKRKALSSGSEDTGSAGNFSILENGPNDSNGLHNSQPLSVLANVEGIHDRQTLRTEDNGQHSSCHVSSMTGQSINKSKRVRTSFKHQQLRTMKQYFVINQNPDAKDLKGLSTKTGLSKRVLQVWFQNARAKWRRNNQKLQEVSPSEVHKNSQTMIDSSASLNPDTPSNSIGSPDESSTRPFSTPSPTLGLTQDQRSINGSSLDQFPSIKGLSPSSVGHSPSSPRHHIQSNPFSAIHHASKQLSGAIYSTPADTIIPQMANFQPLY